MLEWLKRHAWKACSRQKRHGGSNPPLSAKQGLYRGFTMQPFFYCRNAGNCGINGKLCQAEHFEGTPGTEIPGKHDRCTRASRAGG